jgi:hypothetical protein
MKFLLISVGLLMVIYQASGAPTAANVKDYLSLLMEEDAPTYGRETDKSTASMKNQADEVGEDDALASLLAVVMSEESQSEWSIVKGCFKSTACRKTVFYGLKTLVGRK